MADMNKILCNVQQILSDEQKRQIRNNTGLVDSRSIAPIFDPTRVETYPAKSLVMHEGVLYRFKVDHPTGAWTGTDVDETTILNELGTAVPFEAITDWIDISNEFSLANDFTSIYAGQDTKIIKYSPSQHILHFDSTCRFYRTTQIPDDWVVFIKYTGNRFYTSETFDLDKMPKKYGIYNGVPLYAGTLADGDKSQKYVVAEFTGNPDYPKYQGLSVESIELGNYGLTGPLTFKVTPK